jgi:hypothetical protein
MKTKKLDLSVVGMRYRITPPRMRELAQVTPLRVRLVREPRNSSDRNAIRVELADREMEPVSYGMHIGYVPRGIAKELAPKLDDELVKIREAWVTSIDADLGIGEMQVKVEKKKSA